MTKINDVANEAEPASGCFIDATQSLLALFDDKDGRGERRWQRMFGLTRPAPPTPGGIHFSVRVRRQSSSGC